MIPQGLEIVSGDHTYRGHCYLLDVVGSVRRVIDNGMYLLAIFRVDVCQKPVAHDISLDSPGKSELSLLIDKVDETRFRLTDTSSGLLDSISLGSLLRLSNS